MSFSKNLPYKENNLSASHYIKTYLHNNTGNEMNS